MDSTTDNSLRTLWSIIKTAGTPDYIAHGVLVGAEEASGMPDALFADTVNRRFPISDRANTWASAGYFAKTAEEYGYSPEMHECVLARIKRAADLYGIGKDVEDVSETELDNSLSTCVSRQEMCMWERKRFGAFLY